MEAALSIPGSALTRKCVRSFSSAAMRLLPFRGKHLGAAPAGNGPAPVRAGLPRRRRPRRQAADDQGFGIAPCARAEREPRSLARQRKAVWIVIRRFLTRPLSDRA